MTFDGVDRLSCTQPAHVHHLSFSRFADVVFSALACPLFYPRPRVFLVTEALDNPVQALALDIALGGAT